MKRNTKSFDVFLSHNNLDKQAVERIAEQLKCAGLAPWFNKWHLTPGGRWQDELVDGLHASKACAVFVGPHGLGDWEREELGVALTRAAKDRTFRLFLVLLPGLPEPFEASVLPPFLSTRTWVDLRKSITDPRALQPLINAIKGVAPGPETSITPRTDICPYRGLQTFDEEHAEFFFGREGDIQRLLEKLKATRFLAVIGPSGSGKSSLVRAGLIPALRQGKLPGSESWNIRILTPGSQPLTALAAQLLRFYPHAAMQKTLADMATDSRTLHLAVMLALADSPATTHVAWVIDQFEEIFTLCHDKQERLPFFENLLYAAAVPEGRNLVILTMRADFYPKCAAYPELASRIATQQYLVGPMAMEGLQQAIAEPARHVGLELEQGLVETILDEVANQPGSPPLLEHALLELWNCRREQMLTLEGYQETGGVKGAIAQRAEAIYANFNPTQQATVSRILLRLTQPGEGTEDTKRRATMNELITRSSENEAVEEVIRVLANARLLTTSLDEQTGERWVEVSHEALIRGWLRLRQWIDEDRMALRFHRRLTEAANEWLRLNRDHSVLFRGALLAQAQEWREKHEKNLNELEGEFLDAAVAQKRREKEEEQARQHRELEAAQALARSEGKRARVARYFTIGLSVLLVVAVFAAYFARRQQKISRSRELASIALNQLNVDPEHSVLIALEAERASHTFESEDVLRQSLHAFPSYTTLRGHMDIVNSAQFSPDGKYIVTASNDTTARVWEASTGKELAILRGHTRRVNNAQFSLDGKYIVTASDDTTARVWEASTGKELAILRGHTGQVNSAQFSPDSKYIATASWDATARVWAASTGKELAVLRGHMRYVHNAQFSPDGKYIVTASLDATAQVWEASTGKKLAVLRGHMDNVNNAQFSPDGKYIVTASGDATARVWEVSTGKELAVLHGHTGYVNSAQFSPDGKIIVTAGDDATARVWEASTGKGLALLVGHNQLLNSAQFSPDGIYIVTASEDETARIWEASTGEELTVLRGHTGYMGYVESAQFSPDGKYIVTASADETARVWNSSLGEELTILRGHTDNITSAQFSPDGKYIVTASEDKTARVWEASTGKELAVLRGHTGGVSNAQFSPDGKYIVTASADETARVWEASTGKELAILRGHTGGVSNAQFSPDGKCILTAGDVTARVWDVSTDKELAVLRGHTRYIYSAQFSPDGKYVVTAGFGTAVRVWEANTGKAVAVLRGHKRYYATSAQFSPDGKQIMTANSDTTARVWEVSTGKELVVLRGHTDYITSAQFSPDGKYIVTVSVDATARVYWASTGKELAVLRGHKSYIWSVQFSPDSKMIVTTSNDGIALVWKISTGKESAVLRGRTKYCTNSAQFSPDGRYIVTASYDGTARIYLVHIQDLIALAKTRVTRELTCQERQLYLHEDISCEDEKQNRKNVDQ